MLATTYQKGWSYNPSNYNTDTEIGAGKIQIMKISDGLQQLMLGYKKMFCKNKQFHLC
jgi:hypothetical protein